MVTLSAPIKTDSIPLLNTSDLQEVFSRFSRDAQQEMFTRLQKAVAVISEHPDDRGSYEQIAAVMVALGRREAAIDFLASVQTRNPDYAIYRETDFRFRQDQAIERNIPAITLITQFKSASVYLRKVLADGLNIPTCYLAPSPFSERLVPEWLAFFARGGAVTQNHTPPSAENLSIIGQSLLDRVAVHIRDPRQSMISAIHHISGICRGKSGASQLQKAEFPDNFADWPDHRKVDYYLEKYFADNAAWAAGWLDIAKAPPSGLAIFLSSFETFCRDPRAYITNLLQFFGISPSAFDWNALFEPRAGELHFRKGETAEWRRVLTAEQADRASAMMPSVVSDYFSSMAV